MIISSRREQSEKLGEHLHRRDGSSTLVIVDRYSVRGKAQVRLPIATSISVDVERVCWEDRSVWLRLQPDWVWSTPFSACDAVSTRNLTEVDRFVRTITLTEMSLISGYLINARVHLNWSIIALRTPSVHE